MSYKTHSSMSEIQYSTNTLNALAEVQRHHNGTTQPWVASSKYREVASHFIHSHSFSHTNLSQPRQQRPLLLQSTVQMPVPSPAAWSAVSWFSFSSSSASSSSAGGSAAKEPGKKTRGCGKWTEAGTGGEIEVRKRGGVPIDRPRETERTCHCMVPKVEDRNGMSYPR